MTLPTASQLAAPAAPQPSSASNRAAIGWGIGVGVIQAATPLGFWWLDSSTVYALGLAATGRRLCRPRPKGPLAAPHPFRRQHAVVATLLHAVDWVLAAIIVVEIAAGLHFR